MTHPSEAELALYAGGDLGWWKQRRAERHLSGCDRCQQAVSAFSELRVQSAKFPGVPASQWRSLESEMTANIRLGISAGECVSLRNVRTPRSLLGESLSHSLRNGWGLGMGKGGGRGMRQGAVRRLAVASAVLLGAAGIGYVVQHPPAGILTPSVAPGSVLEASDSGLQVHEGSQILRLLNTSGNNVSHSVGSRGELGARYVDPNGYVTISQVYGQ